MLNCATIKPKHDNYETIKFKYDTCVAIKNKYDNFKSNSLKHSNCATILFN